MYVFSGGIDLSRKDAHLFLGRFEGSRAYRAPEKLIGSIKGSCHRLAALIQFESGARVSEVNHLGERDLKGVLKDAVTGKDVGCLRIEKGKGGKSREVYVRPDTYRMVEKEIRKGNGRFEFDKDRYRLGLKEAAEKSGQTYNGSHGLR
ncbi:MAG: hypothetical protein SVO01_04750, partial [Thermotogota bacterium]|nr:hypothetical protein [Thermotogota bacterium]